MTEIESLLAFDLSWPSLPDLSPDIFEAPSAESSSKLSMPGPSLVSTIAAMGLGPKKTQLQYWSLREEWWFVTVATLLWPGWPSEMKELGPNIQARCMHGVLKEWLGHWGEIETCDPTSAAEVHRVLLNSMRWAKLWNQLGLKQTETDRFCQEIANNWSRYQQALEQKVHRFHPAFAESSLPQNLCSMLRVPDYARIGPAAEVAYCKRDYRRGAFPMVTTYRSTPRAIRDWQAWKASEKFNGLPRGCTDFDQQTMGRLENQLIFFPLRAFDELRATLHRQGEELDVLVINQMVDSLLGAMVNEDLEDWTFDQGKAERQLRNLDERQRTEWSIKLRVSFDKVSAQVQEATGWQRLWVTKIGGPSHGFDVSPRCLLPLLGNPRNRALVVYDDEWTEGMGDGCARAYLRLLQLESAPVLYLEPMQRDFYYRHTKSFDESRLRTMLLRAAMMKAERCGLPLYVQPEYQIGEHAEELSFELTPSAVLFEASDTLSDQHDWVQNETYITRSIAVVRVPVSDHEDSDHRSES